jgi:hypothetical protein
MRGRWPCCSIAACTSQWQADCRARRRRFLETPPSAECYACQHFVGYLQSGGAHSANSFRSSARGAALGSAAGLAMVSAGVCADVVSAGCSARDPASAKTLVH